MILQRLVPYRSGLMLCTLMVSASLNACDFSRVYQQSWGLEEVDQQFYEEERTAGRGLRHVLNVMAPVKKIVLEALSEDTTSELLPELKVEATPQAKKAIHISKRIPLEYGELNFFSTRPNRERDLHITQERPKIVKATAISEMALIEEDDQVNELEAEPLIEEMEDTPLAPLKKADFLFKGLSK